MFHESPYDSSDKHISKCDTLWIHCILCAVVEEPDEPAINEAGFRRLLANQVGLGVTTINELIACLKADFIPFE